jgi:DNA-binding MarR family transcriptional regulator
MPLTTDAPLEDRLTVAMMAYWRAISVADPVRLKLWDSRGLTMSQLRLMTVLYQSGSQTVGEMAEELGVKPPTVTGLTDRLIKQDLIGRTSDPADRRIVRLDLTDEGRRVLAEIEVVGRTYMTEVLERMGEEDVEQFVRALDRFTEVAQTVLRESEFRA